MLAFCEYKLFFDYINVEFYTGKCYVILAAIFKGDFKSPVDTASDIHCRVQNDFTAI